MERKTNIQAVWGMMEIAPIGPLRDRSPGLCGVDMRKALAAILPALLMAAAPPPKDYGPIPTWEATTELFEIWAKNNMLAPNKARFEWPYQLVQGTLTPPEDTPIDGYYTCGRLTENGIPVGGNWFIAIARNNRVIWQNIGTGLDFNAADDVCKRLLKQKILRPIEAPVTDGWIGPAAPVQRN